MPVRCDLPDDPNVIAIAAELKTEEDAVVGKLIRLWRWANQHMVDGNAAGVTEIWIDRYVRAPGFARALQNVGWLTIADGSIIIPKFERYNSEGAKRRLLTARRAAKSRTKSNAASVTKSAPTEQNRIEENIKGQTGQKGSTREGGTTGQAGCLTRDFLFSIESQVEGVFRRLGYTGGDGAVIWRAVALWQQGRLAEAWIHDAAQGAALNAKRNPVGFFRTALAELAAREGIDLDVLLGSITLPKDANRGPPRGVKFGSLRQGTGSDERDPDEVMQREAP